MPEAGPKIVVIEDERPIAEAVSARLRSEGFDVEMAFDGPSGVALVERAQPALVVLDLMLPGIDGLEVCRRIQRERPVPVVMLTARDSETDLVIGLGVGADDYLTKPFSPRELVARIRTVLRRAERARELAQSTAVGAPDATVRVGDIEADLQSRRVRNGTEDVHLTPTEFDLLWVLASRPGVVLSREQLLAEVWGYRDGSGVRTVDSHVRALRRKLGPGLIRTVHGVGYAAEG